MKWQVPAQVVPISAPAKSSDERLSRSILAGAGTKSNFKQYKAFSAKICYGTPLCKTGRLLFQTFSAFTLQACWDQENKLKLLPEKSVCLQARPLDLSLLVQTGPSVRFVISLACEHLPLLLRALIKAGGYAADSSIFILETGRQEKKRLAYFQSHQSDP